MIELTQKVQRWGMRNPHTHTFPVLVLSTREAFTFGVALTVVKTANVIYIEVMVSDAVACICIAV